MMNQLLIQYPAQEVNRVQYSTFFQTNTANYYSTATPLVNSTIDIIKDRFVLIGVPLNSNEII
jgi:hypothetical protein